jgi:hypothetical protein
MSESTRTVLVPVDDSDRSTAAVTYAVERYPDADIVALHVVDVIASIHWADPEVTAPSYWEATFEAAEEGAECILAEAERATHLGGWAGVPRHRVEPRVGEVAGDEAGQCGPGQDGCRLANRNPRTIVACWVSPIKALLTSPDNPNAKAGGAPHFGRCARPAAICSRASPPGRAPSPAVPRGAARTHS